MNAFQLAALILAAIWLILVVVRFRRSTVVLIAGLFVVAAYALVCLVTHRLTPDDFGLSPPRSWMLTAGTALGWWALMLVYSPVADWLATRWFAEPPNLESFRAIQHSAIKLIAGIVIAWILGGLLEELVARGIVLKSIESLLASRLNESVSAGIAICVSAVGAGVMHFYQGPRAMVIIAQLSILFGVLFVIAGYNLWAVIMCHGLYDTIAFVRFARKKSRYSH